jgi:uncharacterized membrane protein YdjX (TVP38/TMEM64 family)
MSRRTQKLIIIVSVLAVILLFSFFLKDILVPYIGLEIKNDTAGATELLRDKGVLGFLTVVFVEALQMVVVFIPAEFIQISSGLSYPFWLAVLLCDLGVCLGATLIYLLVRLFSFNTNTYDKNRELIDRLAAGGKKERSVVLLLYFLFIMPLIPCGAICYYASGKKLRYAPYIRTVATGVIPSIVTSNLMGAAGKFFIRNELPLPVLILIIVLLGGLLFLALFLFLDKVYFKENDGTPDSVIYGAFFKLVGLLRGRRQRLHLDNEAMDNVEKPYVLLCNHASFYDFYYVHKLIRGDRAALVVNKHIVDKPILGKLSKKMGLIPKKLFNPDMASTMGMLRAVKAGYPIYIFPEARLSITGVNYPIIEKCGGFCKKLGVDVVLARIDGAYQANPKWRKRFYKSDIRVSVRRVIKKDELNGMTAAELDRIIEEEIHFDDNASPINSYRKKDMAKGLESIIYRCPDCGALYSTSTRGNTLCCSACGAEYHMEPDMTLTAPSGAHTNANELYSRIAAMERAELHKLCLEAPVHTVIFSDGKPRKRRERGFCRLTGEGFFYRSENEEFTIALDKLPALPFSVDTEFELYRGGDLYYFYPDETKRQVTRWALIVDLFKEEHDGKQNR